MHLPSRHHQTAERFCTRRRFLGLGAAALAAAALPAHAAPSPMLSLDGPSLLCGGQPLSLKGVAMGDPLLTRVERPAGDYRHLAEGWGANTVRLSVHPGLWRRQPRRMLAALEAEVAAARGAGQVVIIDWHAIGWPGGSHFRPPARWGLPPDAYDCDLALARFFWSTVASRFGYDRHVIFEIWNEPVRLENEGRLSAPGRDWTELKPILASLVAEIRRHHADNLVLVTGGHWASDLTGVAEDPLDDPRAAYSWHVYPGTARGDLDLLDRLLGDLPQSRAVFVTEWGFGGQDEHLRGGAADFGDAFVHRFLAARGLHWTAWCWHPIWQPALVEPDWQTPTEIGSWVRALMLRAEG
ncbi:cellulase family glycosylhydrolase [Lutibaculum baratangense]|uniref:Cellulase n=1 Tax=Lutibaculum baratangense AMV1 TaxID=631454 RepID=V4TN69_9HYPH|nr:cellulase family glycosylhydrolase [Lutibaculum baratangense]ESR27168.1 Cellulase [Lutibaculum baratangense AMV1]